MKVKVTLTPVGGGIGRDEDHHAEALLAAMRRAVALLLLAGALVAPAAVAAAFPDATFENQCQYSYDDYWRPVPMIFGGTLTDGSGTELPPGRALAVGDTVRLQDGTVSAILPTWIIAFAYESGMIGVGNHDLPVRAWLALEATNTEQGITPPIPLQHDGARARRAHAGRRGRRGALLDDRRPGRPFPTQAWTATGGEVQVRQALGESLPPLPVGRDGADVQVRGSLYVEASLGARRPSSYPRLPPGPAGRSGRDAHRRVARDARRLRRAGLDGQRGSGTPCPARSTPTSCTTRDRRVRGSTSRPCSAARRCGCG